MAIDRLLDSHTSQTEEDQAELARLKSNFADRNKAIEELAQELGQEVDDVLASVRSMLSERSE